VLLLRDGIQNRPPCIIRQYCVMTPESRNDPLLDNGSLGDNGYEIDTYLCEDADSWRPTWLGVPFPRQRNQQWFSRVRRSKEYFPWRPETVLRIRTVTHQLRQDKHHDMRQKAQACFIRDSSAS
jgi:hypothetical protein